MSAEYHRFVTEFLSFLEQREVRLLSWGFYDVFVGASEVEALLEGEAADDLRGLWDVVRGQGWSMDALLDEMAHAHILHRVPGSESFRTRFAEGVRLIARLRQMFRAGDWLAGPTLVSDIKLHVAPRGYPAWNERAEDCWEDLESLCRHGEPQRLTFEALAKRGDGRPLTFAAFQRRTFAHILGRYGSDGVTGSIVSAGTGSGKTKAFYLPAYLGVVGELAAELPEFTKVIAIYPRNVLLADQLREALSEAAKFRSVTDRAGLRPITFGALLGDTPKEEWFQPHRGEPYNIRGLRHWKRVAQGFVVPFVKSPVGDGEDLVWRDEDRRRGRTCLYGARGNQRSPIVPDGVLQLTREQIQAHPPDVLFLSVEMLNREMGNPAWARAFGIGVRSEHAPRLLLLDEVHTYEGVQGAQIAWVLRRWRYWVRARRLHVVGLSATLKEAPAHLGLLAGIPTALIREFTPHAEELRYEGAEYNVAVKGDASSGASLLATTIQTGMLLTRLLTPRHVAEDDDQEVLDGVRLFARKIFGFTDNLDGLNRWYADVLDAERNRLARFRLPPDAQRPPVNAPANVARRMEESGQMWGLPRELGYDLNQSLILSRCSSQDPGADAGSDFIVATSSLEVGYDDPDVGAILHHKKPKSIASFLQRKGRAGRRRGTRPWTVVVLSDFGKDRWAFQNVEQFFQPEVDRIFLPLRNPHVLRTQAVYFLIDWLGRRGGAPDPFLYLAGARSDPGAVREAASSLESLLEQGKVWNAFRKDLRSAFAPRRSDFALGEAELDALIWDGPRSLVRHVVPTLLRKLERNWRLADSERGNHFEDEGVTRPLPEYLPQATFAPLGVGEAQLVFEGRNKDPEHLPVLRMLFEACPGRVSKRYSVRQRDLGYWLAYSERLLVAGPEVVASVRDLFPDRLLIDTLGGIVVYEPQRAPLRERPARVRDSSNASWEWRSQLRGVALGQRLPVFSGQEWTGIVKECSLYVHRDYSGIEVTRYAESCRFEIVEERGRSRRGVVRLRSMVEEGNLVPEAIGFRYQADGIVVGLEGEHLRRVAEVGPSAAARYRTDYLLDRIRNCKILARRVSAFQADWLAQTSIAMLSAVAMRQRCTLSEAQARLRGRRPEASRRAVERIYRGSELAELAGDHEGRRRAEIVQLWSDPEIVARLEVLETCLWEPLGPDYEAWLRGRYAATLAQAIRVALASRASDVSEDDLFVDVQWNADGSADVFLTESAAGGAGQIELIAQEVRKAPHLFHEALRHALSYCPRERTVTNTLGALAEVVGGEDTSELASAFAAVRTAQGYSALSAAKALLQSALQEAGYVATRGMVVSIVTRLLRDGTSRRTDCLTHLLNRARDRRSIELGAEIDPRVFAYVVLQSRPLERRLRTLLLDLSGGVAPTASQLFGALEHFLMPGCEDACPDCLDHPNHYNDFGRPSRRLAADWLGTRVRTISVADCPETWVAEVKAALEDVPRVAVRVTPPHLPLAARGIQELLAEEVAVRFLFLPISIASFERRGREWLITLELKEAVHG